ncbi:hypothetical protein B4089_3730 [Bacillus licheniformis]|nr:hypothetical protein B4089_3609 [Bacillus licheniformis]OLF87260.1 hypothetical protein B4089_3730 [Bacillus licheniformis]
MTFKQQEHIIKLTKQKERIKMQKQKELLKKMEVMTCLIAVK